MVKPCKRNSKKVEKERTGKQMKLASYRWVDQPVNACKRNSKKEKKRTVKQMKLASYRWVSYCWAVRANHLVLKPVLKKVGIIMNKKYREYNMYDNMRSFKNLCKRASASKNQSRNKKLSHRHSFLNPPINTKVRRLRVREKRRKLIQLVLSLIHI